MDCIFCKIINNEIPSFKVWENANFLAILDIMPINPGHILLIPKSHNEEIFKLEDDLYVEIFKIAKKLSEPLKEVTEAKRVGVVIEGFEINHSHIHLVPIYKGHELDRERSKKASEEELKNMQNKILEVLKYKNLD